MTISTDVDSEPETCASEVLLDNRCGTRFFFDQVYGGCICEIRGKDAGLRYSYDHARYRLRKGNTKIHEVFDCIILIIVTNSYNSLIKNTQSNISDNFCLTEDQFGPGFSCKKQKDQEFGIRVKGKVCF